MAVTLTGTNSAKISTALIKARRSAGSPAMGMVLTLIIVCDESEYEAALQASMEAGREHPSPARDGPHRSTPRYGSARAPRARSW